MSAPYFEDLAERLRADGVPADEVEGTIADLAAYVADAGADPEEEFGPAAEFAGSLTGRAAPDGASGDASDGASGGLRPAPDAETWRWTADAFQERARLNEFGDQGWEVERVDHLGRFVSHRDPHHPQRWEYRRETVLGARRRTVTERLAPDGWEPCGTWMYFEYFKRPKAASVGPDAELAAPPAAPARRRYWSRRFYAFMTAYFGGLAVIAVLWLTLADRDSVNGFVVGLFAGAALAGVVLVMQQLLSRRREHSS
ncbi:MULTISPECIES: hypothetical protein [Actinomadura]|uniref:DUF2812 domain-containing protein n=1 Tax=Actinomadura yumaensis TaxID=111807 RepID=A0ABW2CM35_9ACTN|nr:hypothetical protein [Actinomadura sp. J1-007]MWK34248.1 hypothetical protein [Actinomadura sp. J1-007]